MNQALCFCLTQWFSTFSKPWTIVYFLKVCVAHCFLGHRSWTIALWPSASKKEVSTFESALFAKWLGLQKKKRSSPPGERFFPWSEKKVSSLESLIFVNSPLDISEIRLFWTKQPIFRIALWPTAKCPMAHWLRNPGPTTPKQSSVFGSRLQLFCQTRTPQRVDCLAPTEKYACSIVPKDI